MRPSCTSSAPSCRTAATTSMTRHARCPSETRATGRAVFSALVTPVGQCPRDPASARRAAFLPPSRGTRRPDNLAVGCRADPAGRCALREFMDQRGPRPNRRARGNALIAGLSWSSAVSAQQSTSAASASQSS
jgi:hypothetical protein